MEQSWEDSSDKRSVEGGNSVLHHDKGMKSQQIVSQGSNETTWNTAKIQGEENTDVTNLEHTQCQPQYDQRIFQP